MNKQTHACELFKSGYMCSQSVLAAFCEEYGLSKETAFKLTRFLGAGYAFRGEACGAVSGALMVYGLRYGSADPNDTASKEIVDRLNRDHIAEFVRRFDSIRCKDILGCDVSVPEQLDEARKNGLFNEKCPAFIQASVAILEALLSQQDSEEQ